MIPSPLQLKAMLAAAVAAALVIMALTVWGLYWRGEYREAKASLVALQAQGEILAASLRDCNANVSEAKRVGEQAVKDMRALVAEARRLSAGGQRQAAAIEELLNKPTPPGAGCEDAWREVEQTRGAR